MALRFSGRFNVNQAIGPFGSLGVEPASQVLDILEYACGLRLGLALISDKNPNFEMDSRKRFKAVWYGV
jgi:hypothetical protein